MGKKDGDEVRVCGDFSETYNSCANIETYPMPKKEDMHSALRGFTVFSVLDLKQAYHQIPVSKDSQRYLTINTHMGLFAFKRLPNGIHLGPAIFQRIMDRLLADIPKAVSRLDDILIAGADYQDHLNTLSQVLERLLKYGFKLNKAKCKILQSSVVYFGHLIHSAGLHPTIDKLAAVRDAHPPKDAVGCCFKVISWTDYVLLAFYASSSPLPQKCSPKSENVECYFFEASVVTNVTAEMVKKKTQVDPILCLVYRYVQNGWPFVVDASLVIRMNLPSIRDVFFVVPDLWYHRPFEMKYRPSYTKPIQG